MPTALSPVPQYISLANVSEYIGEKVEFGSLNLTQISPLLADQLIAEGEGLALEDLSPYYVTDPALITTTGGSWETLPPYVYAIIYYMFVSASALKIIGNFIARNTDEEGRTLSYFQRYYQSEYNSYLNRIVELLPNGSYKYQLVGLQTLNTGIPRVPKHYARAGNMGAGSYADNQLTNPERNFDNWWGYNGGYWRGWRR